MKLNDFHPPKLLPHQENSITSTADSDESDRIYNYKKTIGNSLIQMIANTKLNFVNNMNLTKIANTVLNASLRTANMSFKDKNATNTLRASPANPFT